MSNFVEKKKEVDFVEAALWGALTFSRRFTEKKISNFEIIKAFKSYLNIDDEYLPDDVAAVKYYRVNKGFKSIMGNKSVNCDMTPCEKIELAIVLINEAKSEM
jgi:GH18 family chitinase